MDSADDDPCGPGCPIRTSPDQNLLAVPRGFSQPATSFIASWCQGIHRIPFEALDFSASARPCAGDAPPPAGLPAGRDRDLVRTDRRIRVKSFHAAGTDKLPKTPPLQAGPSPERGDGRRRKRLRRSMPPPLHQCQRTTPGCLGARETRFPPFRSLRTPRHRSQRPAADPSGGGAARLVEPNGIEPSTSCLQGRRSPD